MKKNKRKEKQTLGLLLRLLDQALLAAWGGPLATWLAGLVGARLLLGRPWGPENVSGIFWNGVQVPLCAPFGHFELVQGVGGIAA